MLDATVTAEQMSQGSRGNATEAPQGEDAGQVRGRPEDAQAELSALAEESRMHAARLKILSEAGHLLAEAYPDVQALLETVARKLTEALGDFVIVSMVSADGEWLQAAAFHHRDPSALAMLEQVLRGRRQPVGEGLSGEVMSTGRSLFFPEFELDQMRGMTASVYRPFVGSFGTHSLLLAPLVARGRVFGTLAAGRTRGSERFREEDRRLFDDLAGQAGLAIENALLYEREREARRAAELARERLTLLADASTILGTSLDVEGTVESLARLVVPSFADLCVVDLVDADGELCNVAAAHVDPLKEARLRAFIDRIRREDRRDTPVRRVIEDRQPWLNQHLRLEDEPRSVLLGEVPIRASILVPMWARGRPVGVLSFARETEAPAYTEEDVTWADELGRRVALAIDNARLYQQMQQAVRLRDDFLGIAGHELRTPLTALQLSLQGLARQAAHGDEAGTSVRRLGACLRQVDRLGKLINELLDVSRITTGRLALQPEEVDLSALVHEVVGRMSDELARARCPVSLHVDEAVVGRWDRARLDQVVTNLLTNAAKYGKGKPIEVSLARAGQAARLTLRDHGIGIAPADQGRIFDRFERAVSERNYGGLGLGLWMVRQIVEAHGGRARVESAVGEGATFVVDLPLG